MTSNNYPRQFAVASLKPWGSIFGVRYPNYYPRQFSVASLKPERRDGGCEAGDVLSAAICRGLIEARWNRVLSADEIALSAAICRGLIEAYLRGCCAADHAALSAAICRGLIEAMT